MKYSHQLLSVEEGLASREVLCGLQDQRGFLWFGTRNGLNRYDGKRFTLLTKRDGLQRNRVVNLAEDKEGNLWISYGKEEGTFDTDGKTDIYNPVSGALMPIEKKFLDLPFDPNEITGIIPNKQGDVYLLIRRTLVYRLKGENFELVVDATEPLEKLLRQLDFTPHANEESLALNISYSFFGKRIKANSEPHKKLSYFNEEGLLEYVSANKSKPSQLVIEKHTLDGGVKLEYKTCDPLTYSILNDLDFIEGRWNDKFGPSILMPLKRGLFVFRDYQCIALLTGSDSGKDFSVNTSFFSDRQNNYWVCTPRGLHKFTPSPKRFQVLFNKEAFDVSDPLGNQIRGIYSDSNGKVWTGGHFGLAYYNRKEAKYYSKLKTEDDIWVHCLDERDGKIYFFGSGCHAVDLSGMEVSRNYLLDLKLDPKAYLSTIGFIWAEYPLPGQRYLLGNDLGKLLVWNIRDNSIVQVESCQDTIPASNFIYRIIYSSQDQHYWAAGGSGCYRLAKDLCISDYYGTENVIDEAHKLPVSDFRDLYEDPEGIFWLATNGEGLLRWDRKKHEFQLFTIQDGMPSNILYCIQPDEYGNLWVSTDNGLVRFNKNTHNINVFSTKDGIAHNEFNRVSSFKGSDGTLYFGGIDGLTAFHPRDFGSDTTNGQIPLQITDYYQFLGSTNQLTNLTHHLLTEKKIVLRPGDKFFRLEFALLDFQSSGGNYRYQIEGFDKDWQYIKEPLLRISGLPYGTYKLRLAGQSYSGTWSKHELAIPIRVLRPFYLKWWAFMLYGLTLLGFLYLIREYQIRRLLEKADKKRLQEIDFLKTKLYTNITHEFRTPLTVIIGMSEQLVEDGAKWKTGSQQGKEGFFAKIQDRSELILRNARSLLHLINQMLDLSKLDSGKLEIQWEFGDVVLFMQYLSESFHSYAETKRIQLTYYPEVKSLEMDFDREKLQQVISNLLSNAIKYSTEGGKVIFHVSEVQTSPDNRDSVLQIKISNSGIGIPPEHLTNIFDRFYQVEPGSYFDTSQLSEPTQMTFRSDGGTGIGLALTKDLVELMGGSISVTSEVGKGADFIVRLPIQKFANRSTDFPEIVTLEPPSDQLVAYRRKEYEHITDDTPLLLLIEDNADVASYIRDCINGRYTVLWAKNGQLGIDMALETVPDIIISDVMMPEKDGYEVTQFLKNDERTSHIPIILLTAKAGISSKITGLERGADAYLSKPFDKKELLVRMEKLVELRQKLQARYAGEQVFAISKTAVTEPAPYSEKGIQIEEAFLVRVNEILERHLSDSEFQVPQLSQELHMSHSQLYRKIKALTDKSIASYLRSYRLYKGKELLLTTELNVSEVAYEVGFTDPAYFSRLFSEEFGMPPIDARK